MYLTIFSAINLVILATASTNGFFGELSKFPSLEDENDQLPKFEESNKPLRPDNIGRSLPIEGLLKMLQTHYPKVYDIGADTVNLKLSFFENKEDKKNCTVEVTKSGSIKSFRCQSTKEQHNDFSTVPEKNLKRKAEEKEIVDKKNPTLAVRSKLGLFPERGSSFRNNNTNNNILSVSYQH